MKFKKDLIVVGNRHPSKIMTNQVDSFDYIMRTGRMNYLGFTGNRIDGLFLEANMEFKEIFKGGKYTKSITYASQILMKDTWYQHFSDWNQYITIQQYNEITIIDENKYCEGLRLTSAVFLIKYLLSTPQWAEKYNIYFTCLDVENRAKLIDNNPIWAWHKGVGLYEEAFLKTNIENKVLFRLDDE